MHIKKLLLIKFVLLNFLFIIQLIYLCRRNGLTTRHLFTTTRILFTENTWSCSIPAYLHVMSMSNCILKNIFWTSIRNLHTLHSKCPTVQIRMPFAQPCSYLSLPLRYGWQWGVMMYKSTITSYVNPPVG